MTSSGDWLEIPDHTSLHISDRLSIQFWVRPEALGSATVVAKSGEYEITSNATGHLSLTVHTGTGTYSLTSTVAMESGRWYWVKAQMSDGILSLAVDAAASNVAYSGQITPGTSPILVGTSFQGNMDNLVISCFQTGSSNLVTLSGLVDGKVTLDASGHAEVWLASTGVLDPSLYGNEVSIYVSASPTQSQEVKVRAKGVWGYVGSFFAGFGWGGGSGVTGFGGQMVSGLVGWSDITDLTRNFAYIWPGGNDPDKAVMLLAAVGIALTGNPIIDGPVTTFRILIKQLGRSALRQGLVEVVFTSWRQHGIRAAVGVITENAACVAHLVASPGTVIDGLKAACKNGPEFTQQIFKIHKHLGAEATNLVADIALRADLGGEVASKVAKVLGESGDEVLAGLKKAGQVSDEAVEGLAKALQKGVDPEAVKKLLTNEALYTNLGQADLWARINKLADRDVEGLADYLTTLSKANPESVAGYPWELASACKLQDEGFDTIRKISPPNSKLDKWGADFIGDKHIYQAKSGPDYFRRDFGEVTSELARSEQAVRAKIGGQSIMLIVPPGTIGGIPQKVLSWLASRTPPMGVMEVAW